MWQEQSRYLLKQDLLLSFFPKWLILILFVIPYCHLSCYNLIFLRYILLIPQDITEVLPGLLGNLLGIPALPSALF